MKKSLLLTGLCALIFSAVAWADSSASVIVSISQLKISFAKSATVQNSFDYTGISMTCSGQTDLGGDILKNDCSQKITARDGKSTLTYQISGTQAIFTMNMADVDGNLQTSVIHAQLLESGNMTAMENGAPVVYMMSAADAQSLASHYRVTDADVKAGLKTDVKGQGRVILSSDGSAEVDYPDFDMYLNINVN